MAIDCTNLGKICFARKNLDQARDFLARSTELYRAIGNEAMADSIENAITEIGRAAESGMKLANDNPSICFIPMRWCSKPT